MDRDGMWGGGSIPKTGFSERRKLSSTRKKNQFRTEGGSIGEIPEEKLEFRGRKVVSGMKKTEFRYGRGDSIRQIPNKGEKWKSP